MNMKKLDIKFIKSSDKISDAESVRVQVFQIEQGIAQELDFDGKDKEATHIVVYHEKKAVGTGRIRNVDTTSVKIERVAVLSEMRGRGIGKIIMSEIDSHLAKSDIARATLDAQLHAKGFYESLGYVQDGEIFEEVGIPHVVMVKSFEKSS